MIVWLASFVFSRVHILHWTHCVEGMGIAPLHTNSTVSCADAFCKHKNRFHRRNRIQKNKISLDALCGRCGYSKLFCTQTLLCLMWIPFANTRTNCIAKTEYKNIKFHGTHCVEGVGIANFIVHKLYGVLCGFLSQT